MLLDRIHSLRMGQSHREVPTFCFKCTNTVDDYAVIIDRVFCFKSLHCAIHVFRIVRIHCFFAHEMTKNFVEK